MANINSSIGALLFVTAFTKPTSTHTLLYNFGETWNNKRDLINAMISQPVKSQMTFCCAVLLVTKCIKRKATVFLHG